MKYLFAFLFVFLNAVGYAQNFYGSCSCESLSQDSLALSETPVFGCDNKDYSIIVSWLSTENRPKARYAEIHIGSPKAYGRISADLKKINSCTNNSLSKIEQLIVFCHDHDYKLYPPLDFKFDSLKNFSINYDFNDVLKSKKKLSNENIDQWRQFFDKHPDLVIEGFEIPMPIALAEYIIKNTPKSNSVNLMYIERDENSNILDTIVKYKPNLKSLYINIEGYTLPASFANLQQLEWLYIKNISDNISLDYVEQLPQLKVLNLVLNTKKGYTKTLLSISRMKNLEFLGIGTDKKEKFAYSLSKIRLPQEFAALSKLSTLSIENIDICAPENAYIFDILQNMPELAALHTNCGDYDLINDDLGLKLSKVIKKPSEKTPSFIFLSEKSSKKLARKQKDYLEYTNFIKNKNMLLSKYLNVPKSIEVVDLYRIKVR